MKNGNTSQQAKQKDPKVLGTVTIDVLDNNSVTVNGPINQPALILDIFSKAMAAVAQHIAKQESKLIAAPPPKIVTPGRKN
jgi:phosphoribosyl-dephospho-CoA transferase